VTGTEVRGLCKSLGAAQALDGVDLRAWAGRVHALLGP
jgi:ABC-type sugar transport system ATPase subunit